MNKNRKKVLAWFREQTLPFVMHPSKLGEKFGYNIKFNNQGQPIDCANGRGILKQFKIAGLIDWEKVEGGYNILWVKPAEEQEVTSPEEPDNKIVPFRPVSAQEIDGWEVVEDKWVTARELAQQLGYNKRQSVTDIYNAHKNFFIEEKDSVVLNLRTTDGKKYDTRCFSFSGGLKICRYSNQPKADDVMQALIDLGDKVRSGELRISQSVPNMLRGIADILEKHDDKFVDVEQDISLLFTETQTLNTKLKTLEQNHSKKRSENLLRKRRLTTIEKDIALEALPICQKCGRPFSASEPNLRVTQHHIKPYEHGGLTNFDNIALLHKECHDETHLNCTPNNVHLVCFKFRTLGFAVFCYTELEKVAKKKRRKSRPSDYVPYLSPYFGESEPYDEEKTG